jgi:isochorismate synthase
MLKQPLLQNSTDDKFMDLLFQAAISTRSSVVIWRLPGEREKQAIIDFSHASTKLDLDFSKIQPGFVFTPFMSQERKSSIYLKADLLITNSGAAYYSDHETQADKKLLFENSFKELASKNGKNGENKIAKNLTYKSPNKSEINVTKKQFCHWVKQAKKQIQDNKLNKVVLTRALEVKLEDRFNPLELFNKLCMAYPNAFVSLVAIPGAGTWIGATPELLLSVNRNELLTVALAGTQPISSDIDLSYITWGDKELKEQAFVSDYIRNCFLQQSVHDFIEYEPETVRAGNLLHLQTRFQLQLPQNNLGEKANRILKELHPTPAVCGVPKKAALDFILDYESHDREFYTGYLGPVNMEGQSHLFVNLRCMQLTTETAILYAGSGITIDSEPEKEWQEAELKLNTLLNFLKKDSSTARAESAHLAQDSELYRVLCDEKV